MASATAHLFILIALEIFCHCDGLWSQAEGRQELVLYPRVGKRGLSADPRVTRRRDFLNFLANSWQRTGSLRGAIHEIQDMTESKRAVGEPLIFPGPRVGRSTKEEEESPSAYADKKWSKARIGKKSGALIDDDGTVITYFEDPKRVPFARLG